ncbi:hypothetical protein ACPX19_11345 [Winogradskyella sp. HB-48]|uniref:hypothetical protein n=1 Tax=Winogradskyella sp. HB-48 TaxID=3416808 RepID=UPI003CEB8332
MELDFKYWNEEYTDEQKKKDLNYILNSPMRIKITTDNIKENLEFVSNLLLEYYKKIEDNKPKNILELMEDFCKAMSWEDGFIERNKYLID